MKEYHVTIKAIIKETYRGIMFGEVGHSAA
jgi:hypothetical protein